MEKTPSEQGREPTTNSTVKELPTLNPLAPYTKESSVFRWSTSSCLNRDTTDTVSGIPTNWWEAIALTAARTTVVRIVTYIRDISFLWFVLLAMFGRSHNNTQHFIFLFKKKKNEKQKQNKTNNVLFQMEQSCSLLWFMYKQAQLIALFRNSVRIKILKNIEWTEKQKTWSLRTYKKGSKIAIFFYKEPCNRREVRANLSYVSL